MTGNKNGTSTTSTDTAQRLCEEKRIADILPLYARYVDDSDAQGIGSLFAEDGKMVVKASGYEIASREEIEQRFGKMLGEIAKSNHLVGTPLVRWKDDDHATAEAALNAWDRYKDGRPDCYTYGRYLIDVSRTADGSWLVDAFTFDFAIQLDGPQR